MKFAYADPPYMGCAKFYDHPEASIYDTLPGHKLLLERLHDEYPDGWAYSCGSKDLYEILILNILKRPRIMAWCKPFASFKPNVGLAYTWEPVLLYGGRKITREQNTIKDHLACSITLKKGLTGAKPLQFCQWVLAALNYQPGDTLDDLFPGTGIMGRCLDDENLRLAV